MNKLLPRDIIVRLLDSYSSFLDLSQDQTDVQCLHRCQKVFNPELVKGPWPKQVVTLVIIVDMIAWMQEGGQALAAHSSEAVRMKGATEVMSAMNKLTSWWKTLC
ncbi:hypothetical protein HanRHA438_Chr05g0211751 [Helianthus annuus]|uniref:uncharacterized protein LOC110940518 isoform X4 n=1 Tax=Helianthus annuus TaxID=4232 RepID=UPI000B909239|nr:uncharacterized protein LOC110940518 isoform X4 [Helianthus annuus]KAJ0917932.1 hypothetical protein HanRHA438_Chr05g0211751 [Helianthus annuus]